MVSPPGVVCVWCVACELSQTLVECKATENQVDHVTQMFDTFKNSFDHLSTEYKRFQFFAATGTYIAPEPYEIGVIDVAAASASGPVLN